MKKQSVKKLFIPVTLLAALLATLAPRTAGIYRTSLKYSGGRRVVDNMEYDE